MKYLFFTFEGEGLPIAYHLQQEGHDVTVGMVENASDTILPIEKDSGTETEKQKLKRQRLFSEMLPIIPATELLSQMEKIPDPENYFVFFEMNHLFKFATKVSQMGNFHGNFPTEEDYHLEINRIHAKEFVKKHYHLLSVPNTQQFSTVKDAIQFLDTTSALWVLKAFNPDIGVFIPETKDPIIFRKQLKEELIAFQDMYESSGFMVEEYIPHLIEITPERIYYDGTLLGSTMNFENKQIGSGNLSFQTGCSADLIFPVELGSKLDALAFPPFVDELAKKHKGLFIWDASLLIDSETEKVYFGEFCSNRPGYNSMYTELAPLQSVHSFFEKIVQKKDPYDYNRVGASTRIFNLNRSSDDTEILSDVPITLAEPDNKDIWLMDVYKKENEIRVSGYDMSLAAVTGSGTSISDAVNHTFANINTFSYGGKYYRPKWDFLSKDYPTSILNRLAFVMKHNLISVPKRLVESLDLPS